MSTTGVLFALLDFANNDNSVLPVDAEEIEAAYDAAHEVLSSLKQALDFIEREAEMRSAAMGGEASDSYVNEPHELADRLRAAIAKAEGGAP
jgi:hypothetical protein